MERVNLDNYKLGDAVVLDAPLSFNPDMSLTQLSKKRHYQVCEDNGIKSLKYIVTKSHKFDIINQEIEDLPDEVEDL